ncbi:CHASE2 domain-containing protein [Methylobacterium nonmethylotrophicum]|uniref:Adenylate/guanylate cyclase domain-containing protein n=1 Tax=Methylobacterium nonmethylotrophicum TaxID=1141884 RepID=A0A4Z0NP20_9HYPH|nr:adenylate/guanylate cyclase domain-containing protein [Methylobacterium nonmethylotrophicum]TGD97958.1 adenylate/guanylate cyclase domain-containing protein [Methylobacterium nonmethylotrophicum]
MKARWPITRVVHAVLLLVLATLWSGLLAAWHLEGRETLLDRLEFQLLDLRHLAIGPRPAPDAVVIVAIDEAAIREAGAYPLPRAALARLVHGIADRQARAIGLDMLLLDRTQEDADASLEAALGRARAVLAGAAVFAPSHGAQIHDGAGLPVAEHVLRPLQRFRAGTGLGLVNVSSDRNGTPRHLPLLIAEASGVLPAFSLRVAAAAAAADPVLDADSLTLGPVSSRLDLGFSLPLRFYGPKGTVRTLSAAAVLRNEGVAALLRDRIVLIGAAALGIADTFATPYDPVLPGVEVLATGVAHLVAGDALVRDRTVRRLDAGAAVGLAVLAAGLLVVAPSGLAAGLIVLAVLGWLAATTLGFASQVWLNAVLPLAALAPVVAFGLGGRLVLDRSDARRVAAAEQALRAFHPPRLAARIAQDPGFLAEPSAQAAAILFLDLSGFTGVSERLGPQATRGLLKGFHTLVEEHVSRHGGIVVSFMGDGAMCVFGLAEPDPGDARRALGAALELVPAIRAWLAGTGAFDGAGDVRIGIHHGEVVVSRLGSAEHQHIAATGDSVNLTSRLMEVGKTLGFALVASESLLTAAGEAAAAQAAFEGRCTVAIRGRAQPLAVAYRWAREEVADG